MSPAVLAGALLMCGFAAAAGSQADYADLITEAQPRADGRRHVDAPALIGRLKTLHADTYYYLVHGTLDWDDLTKEFLPAAARAGIDVWAYFVPPSECPAPCALPFGTDYIRTAAEIAKFSLTYPNFKGLAIDDFVYNLSLYTPEYIGRLRDAGRAVNPKFQFHPLLYWRSMLPEFLDKYAPVIDGVVFAYRDEPTINTSRNGSLSAQLQAAEALMSARGKALVLMIYCSPLGSIPIPPSVNYVREAVAMGLRDVRQGKLAGVVTYKLSKSGLPTPQTENRAHGGNGRATILASGSGLKAGDYGEISRPVSITSDARLSFWRTAVYSRLPPGYFFLQILLGDRVVWEQDVAGFESRAWKQESVEFPAPAQKTTLRFRLAVKRNTGSIIVSVGIDDLAPEGFPLDDPGFENPAGWQVTQTSPAFLPMIQIFDPQDKIRMFEAVRHVYGGGSAGR